MIVLYIYIYLYFILAYLKLLNI